jgi:hypothetical protein
MPYASEVLADNPLGYWKLDETSGVTAADSSGNGRHAALQNNPHLGGAPIARIIADASCYFNGVNQYGLIDYVAALQPTRITLELWVIRHSSGSVTTVFGSQHTGGYSVDFREGDVIRCNVWVSAYKFFDIPIEVDEAAHIAFTFDGRYLKGYKNGVYLGQNDTGAINNIGYPYNTYKMIGANPPSSGPVPEAGYFVHAALSHVAIYGTALSAERIAAHYAATVRSLNLEIIEDLAAVKFDISAHRVSDGLLVGRKTSAAGAVSLAVDSVDPVLVTVAPQYGNVWKPATAYAAGDTAIPGDPVSTPYYYKRLTAGTSGAAEPSWPTTPGGRCNDGAVTDAWELVERLIQPITHGPLIPF